MFEQVAGFVAENIIMLLVSVFLIVLLGFLWIKIEGARARAVSLAVVLMALFSLFSMIGMFEIDRIVHGDLYEYGLRFSYQWAEPYWGNIRFMFVLGWSSVVAAVFVLLYMAFSKENRL